MKRNPHPYAPVVTYGSDACILSTARQCRAQSTQVSGEKHSASPRFSFIPAPIMGSFGPLEIILIFLVVLLIFGAKRIPEIARGIGKGIREFKDATNEISREIESEGQSQQINQPRAPEQGQPQSRQPQRQERTSEPTATTNEPAADAEGPEEENTEKETS